MRILGCGVIAVAVLLGPGPLALADESTDGSRPQTEVSMLAVTLTAGGAVAMAGSGVALALTRRRQ